MNSNAIPLGNVHWARWSGESEPKPAIINDGIPCPLTHDQLEDTLVEALIRIQELEGKIRGDKP